MFDTAEWTVVALRRYLKEHKRTTSGLKAALRERCEKHSKKCKCSSKGRPAADSAPAPEQICLNDILNTITWTPSLHGCPDLCHRSIYAYKASDKHMKGGYIMFKEGKVENMLVGRDEAGDFYCKGRVSPAMKTHRYWSSLKITGTTISDTDCTCPAGKGKCKHAMALLYALIDLIMTQSEYIPESLACTSQPRQWGRVSCKPVISNVANFSELVPRTVCHDPDNPEAAVIQAERAKNQLLYSSLPADAALMDVTRHDILTAHHPFWRRLITQANPQSTTSCVETKPLKNMCVDPELPLTTSATDNTAELAVSEPFADQQLSDHEMTLEVTTVSPVNTGTTTSVSRGGEWDIDSDLLSAASDHPPTEPHELPPNYERYRHDVEVSTRGQADNPAWQKARVGKITASTIGTIYSLRPSTKPDNLLAQINQTKQTDLSRVPAIRHGRLYEHAAKLHYEKVHGVQILDRGFMLHPHHPWLGASTDGFIADPPAAVEIKCPLADNDDQNIEALASLRKNWFLDSDGCHVCLRPNHKYHYQCQIQMECLGVESCVFIVYLCSKDGVYKDMYVELIKKDPKLVTDLINKANKFYIQYLKV